MPATKTALQRAASRVTLALVVEPVAHELYGTIELVMDETATLRRVALFFRGSGRYKLTLAEKVSALEIIRGRDDERTAA